MPRNSNNPKWLNKKMEPESTRARSTRQEKKVAFMLGGKVTKNSGATYGQNDVLQESCEVECKTTSHSSFRLTIADWEKAEQKCDLNKVPLMVIEFTATDRSLVVLSMDDLQSLLRNQIKK